MYRLTEQGKGRPGRRGGIGIGVEGPSVADLEAIEAEWPVIAAEVALVDAESAFVRAPGDITARRVAKADRALRRVLVERRAAGVRGFGGAA